MISGIALVPVMIKMCQFSDFAQHLKQSDLLRAIRMPIGMVNSRLGFVGSLDFGCRGLTRKSQELETDEFGVAGFTRYNVRRALFITSVSGVPRGV